MCRVQASSVAGVFKTPRVDGGSSSSSSSGGGSSSLKKKEKLPSKEADSRKRKRTALEEIREVMWSKLLSFFHLVFCSFLL